MSSAEIFTQLTRLINCFPEFNQILNAKSADDKEVTTIWSSISRKTWLLLLYFRKQTKYKKKKKSSQDE